MAEEAGRAAEAGETLILEIAFLTSTPDIGRELNAGVICRAVATMVSALSLAEIAKTRNRGATAQALCR